MGSHDIFKHIMTSVESAISEMVCCGKNGGGGGISESVWLDNTLSHTVVRLRKKSQYIPLPHDFSVHRVLFSHKVATMLIMVFCIPGLHIILHLGSALRERRTESSWKLEMDDFKYATWISIRINRVKMAIIVYQY